MSDSNYKISDNGMIDIHLGTIRLRDIYPGIDERPVLPLSIEAGEDVITYSASGGEISLRLRTDRVGTKASDKCRECLDIIARARA